LRTVTATRYVAPLREGGSLPGLMEADDDGLYVVKFRGAGQGPLALVAELVAGEIGRALGLPVPELALCDVDDALARAEPDPEIQDLIRASGGINLGMDFLPGSLPFTAAADVDAAFAADVVWFDALMTNVDRTPRNANLICWHGRVWLIDHGAAMYRQHGADDFAAEAGRPFPQIAEHVLLPAADSVLEAGARLDERLDEALVAEILARVPDAWLGERERSGYVTWVMTRLRSGAFAREAEEARLAAA
jgi:hypothetical protein